MPLSWRKVTHFSGNICNFECQITNPFQNLNKLSMNISGILPAFLFGMKGWQLIIVLLLILLLFGANRIPSLMRNLGKSVHSFKQGMADAEAEIKKPVHKADNEEKEEIKAKDTEK